MAQLDAAVNHVAPIRTGVLFPAAVANSADAVRHLFHRTAELGLRINSSSSACQARILPFPPTSSLHPFNWVISLSRPAITEVESHHRLLPFPQPVDTWGCQRHIRLDPSWHF